MKNHNLLVLCLLLAIASNWNEAAPTESSHQQADGAHDIRWRLVSGLETAYQYTNHMHVHLQACERKLLNVSGDLSSILSGMCQLMEVQQLAAKVHTGSDLHAILEQNVLDFCQWLNFLVEVDKVTASMRFLQLNDTCEVGETPRLSQYCLERRLASFYKNIYLPASNFYADSVVNHDIPMWLETSGVPPEEVHSIQDLLKRPLNCTD